VRDFVLNGLSRDDLVEQMRQVKVVKVMEQLSDRDLAAVYPGRVLESDVSSHELPAAHRDEGSAVAFASL
jgi:hypothetical protein